MPRRLVHYSDLVPDLVASLVAEGIADTEGLRPSHGYYSAGRYLRLHRKFGLWLGVDIEAWKRYGLTPIWSEHNTGSPWCGFKGRIREAEGVFEEARVHGGNLYLPIHLKMGVDRVRVVENALQQLRSIGDQLREAFFNPTAKAKAPE